MRLSILSLVAALPAASAMGASLLAPGDFIIGIDGLPASQSNYPVGEAPSFAIDGVVGEVNGTGATKYLNFGGSNSGFIITPVSGASIVQSFQIYTGNDADGRDPYSFELYGTNDAITSENNSTGLAENWSLIGSGLTNLPVDRNAPGPFIDLTNATSYTSYRMVFPEVFTEGSLMQFNEIQFYTGTQGGGSTIFAPGDPILAIDEDMVARPSPITETAVNAIDGDINTKYLNFGRMGSGVIVTPSGGPSVVKSIQLTTANDFPERDAATFEIYGTNDAITSEEDSDGTAENWVLIDSGSLGLPGVPGTVDPADDFRLKAGSPVNIDNNTAYTSYKIVFPTLKDNSGVYPADSFQVAEIQLFDTAVVIGDTDSDGDVDDFDLIAAITNYTGSLDPGVGGKTNVEGDTDYDGDVDDFDLINMIVGYTGALSAPSVPEPTSMALLGLGGLALLRRRR